MEGIHILNTYDHFGGSGVATAGLIVLIVCAVLLIAAIIEKIIWLIIISMCFMVLGASGIYVGERQVVPRMEVIIDDGVTFSDLITHYDVVGQRGEIFVVEEKNQ